MNNQNFQQQQKFGQGDQSFPQFPIQQGQGANVAHGSGSESFINWDGSQRPSPPDSVGGNGHNVSSSQATSMESGQNSSNKGGGGSSSDTEGRASSNMGSRSAKASAAKADKESPKKRRKRTKHRKKGDDPLFSVSKPKRPRTAYNFFVKEERPKIVKLLNDQKARARPGEEQQGSNFENIGKILGQRWNNLDPATKARYDALAKEDTDRYTDETKNFYTKMYLHPEITEAAEKANSNLQFQLTNPDANNDSKKSAEGGGIQKAEQQSQPLVQQQSTQQSPAPPPQQAQAQQEQQQQQSSNLPQDFSFGNLGQNISLLGDQSQSGGQGQNFLSAVQGPQVHGLSLNHFQPQNQFQVISNQLFPQNFGQNQNQANVQLQLQQLQQQQQQQSQSSTPLQGQNQNIMQGNPIDMNTLLSQYAGYLNSSQALFNQFQGVINQLGQQQSQQQHQNQQLQQFQQPQQQQQIQQQQQQQPQQQQQQNQQQQPQQDSYSTNSANTQQHQLQQAAFLQGLPFQQLGASQAGTNTGGGNANLVAQNNFSFNDQQGQQNAMVSAVQGQQGQQGLNLNLQQQPFQQNVGNNLPLNNDGSLNNQALQQWLWSVNQGNQNNGGN